MALEMSRRHLLHFGANDATPTRASTMRGVERHTGEPVPSEVPTLFPGPADGPPDRTGEETNTFSMPPTPFRHGGGPHSACQRLPTGTSGRTALRSCLPGYIGTRAVDEDLRAGVRPSFDSRHLHSSSGCERPGPNAARGVDQTRWRPASDRWARSTISPCPCTRRRAR